MSVLLASGNAPIEVLCDGLTVVNNGPGTVYYGATRNVSTTTNSGSISSGGSVGLLGAQFFITSSSAELALNPTASYPKSLSYIDARDHGVRADGRFTVDVVST